MSGLIHGVHGRVYTPQQSSQLYPTAGDTTDWTYGEYGIPSFTIELRPDRVRRRRLHPAADQIQPTWEEPAGRVRVHRGMPLGEAESGNRRKDV